MKVAFLFSGQGTQHVGMGQELYDNYPESRKIFDLANDTLDWDVKEVCFTDENKVLNQTRFTQAALFTTTIAAYAVASSKGIQAEAVSGFSLGEWSALVASGILDFQEALRLVDKRAYYMDQAANNNKGSMMAVIGLDNEKVEEVCKSLMSQGKVVSLANDNCPGQVVISGEVDAAKEASSILKEEGAKRVMPLRVSGAFHSPLMQEAANQLKQELDESTFKEPTIPIVSNVSADYMDKQEAINNIPTQIVTGVRFRESVERLIEDGFDTFIEIGVKNTLCNMVKRISKDVKTMHIEDIKTLDQVLEQLGGDLC